MTQETFEKAKMITNKINVINEICKNIQGSIKRENNSPTSSPIELRDRYLDRRIVTLTHDEALIILRFVKALRKLELRTLERELEEL